MDVREQIKEFMRGSKFWLLAAAGLGAGFVNGLLGAGGGIIVIFALTKLIGGDILQKNAVFGNALCVMLPISVLTCVMYAERGYMSLGGFGVFAIPALLGGLVGGLVLGKLDTAMLKKGFAGLVIISGIILMVR